MKIKIFLCLLSFVFCSIVAFADESTESAPSSQQLQGFNLNGYSNTGQKTWDVNGTKADISDSNIQITNVDANFYGKDHGNLKADHGTIDKVNGNVHLQDNVVVTADRGTQMTTDTLNWNRDKDLVTTQDSVKIVDQQGVVTGQGLTAHPNLKKAQINSDVKAVVQTNAKEPSSPQTVIVTSDGPMQMDQVKMYAVFNVHVVAVDQATGRELHSDKMEIWFDQATKHIKKAICTGHVKVVQGPNVSYADEMIYMGDTQVLTMIGRPKIVFDTGSTKNGMFQPLGK